MKYKRYIVFMIISVFIVFAMSTILVNVYGIYNVSVNNTTEHTGTVNEVALNSRLISITKQEDGGQIYLMVEHLSKYDEEFKSLQPNQTIHYRIPNAQLNNFVNGKLSFAEAVSLRTETKTIFTLDDFNNSVSKEFTGAFVTSIGVGAAFIVLFVYSFLKLLKYKACKKQMKTMNT